MRESEIQDLVKKYLNDTATAEERDRLLEWYRGSNSHTETLEWLVEDEKEVLQLKADLLHDIQQEIHNVQREIDYSTGPASKSDFIPRFLAIAAAILLVLGSGLYFYVDYHVGNIRKLNPLAQDIKPGGDKAFLTLADGRRISLTDVGSGEIVHEEGISITKTKDGRLVYRMNKQLKVTDGKPEYNTVETPKGGQFQIILPDGSKVWLNAASSVKFPATFENMANRMVELNGEAYFEVKKNHAQPFIVKTARQKVEVLGTHFNINSYSNDGVVKTTLLEGSVKIEAQTPDGKKLEILKPGQQALTDGTGMKVKEVDAEDAIDWKTGYFQFNNEELESIMLKLSRWYNMEVRYHDPEVKKETFQGGVSRYENVSKVLKMLQRTEVVRFSVEGNLITVYKK